MGKDGPLGRRTSSVFCPLLGVIGCPLTFRQASYDAPTTSELLELAAENDGTVEGASKAEEKRNKEENWARYTEENKRGAGNTMNRG